MKTLLLDDSKIFLEGLSMILSQNSLIDSIHSVRKFDDAEPFLKSGEIDLIIIDLNLGTNEEDGISICKKVKLEYPKIKIIVLTGYLKIDCIEILYNKIRIEGYASKDAGKKELFEAVGSIAKGMRYLDKEAQILIERGKWNRLSEREIEVLNLTSKGLTKKEVANILHLSQHTVRRHLDNLMEKFNASNTAQLVGEYNKYRSSNHENFNDKTPPFVSS
jgi:DNA-binding NarL/FixJ family response regulator